LKSYLDTLRLEKKNEKGEYLHKTKEQGTYYVVNLDFSSLKLDPDNPDAFVPAFNELITQQIENCAAKYGLAMNDTKGTYNALSDFRCAANRDTKIIAILDHYDAPFTQIIMDSDLSLAQKGDILNGIICHYGGFFMALKSRQIGFFLTGILNVGMLILTPTLS